MSLCKVLKLSQYFTNEKTFVEDSVPIVKFFNDFLSTGRKNNIFFIKPMSRRFNTRLYYIYKTAVVNWNRISQNGDASAVDDIKDYSYKIRYFETSRTRPKEWSCKFLKAKSNPYLQLTESLNFTGHGVLL